MPSSRLIICAETVILDSGQNAVSVINILEDITPEGFPFLISKLMVLSVLTRDHSEDTQFDVTLRIDLDQETIFETNTQIDFQDGERNRHIIGLGGLVMPHPGILRTHIIIAGEIIHYYDINIKAPRVTETEV